MSAGKVRYIGVSNYAGWQLMKALGVSDRRGISRFVSQQIYYSLQARDAEYELVPVSLDQGLGILVWSPLAGGLLSGKYRRGVEAPAGSRHLGEWSEPPVYDEDKLYDTVDALVEIADAHGVSAAQVSLAWLIGRAGVTSVVVGARTEEQLADNLKAADLDIVGRRAGQARRGERDATALSALASGEHLGRPPWCSRAEPARPTSPTRQLTPRTHGADHDRERRHLTRCATLQS